LLRLSREADGVVGKVETDSFTQADAVLGTAPDEMQGMVSVIRFTENVGDNNTQLQRVPTAAWDHRAGTRTVLPARQSAVDVHSAGSPLQWSAVRRFIFGQRTVLCVVLGGAKI
jgi:hypothetical protein